MHRRLLQLALIIVGFASLGCYPPSFRHPGNTPYQRHQATLHDPYPDADLGPQIDGGRPREFQKPLAEPVRNRWLRDSWWSRGEQ